MTHAEELFKKMGGLMKGEKIEDCIKACVVMMNNLSANCELWALLQLDLIRHLIMSRIVNDPVKVSKQAKKVDLGCYIG